RGGRRSPAMGTDVGGGGSSRGRGRRPLRHLTESALTESRRRQAYGVESATARRSSAGARSSARTSSRPAAVVGNGFVALGTIVPAFRSPGLNPRQDTSGTRFAVCLRSTSLGRRQGASGFRERLLQRRRHDQ